MLLLANCSFPPPWPPPSTCKKKRRKKKEKSSTLSKSFRKFQILYKILFRTSWLPPPPSSSLVENKHATHPHSTLQHKNLLPLLFPILQVITFHLFTFQTKFSLLYKLSLSIHIGMRFEYIYWNALVCLFTSIEIKTKSIEIETIINPISSIPGLECVR